MNLKKLKDIINRIPDKDAENLTVVIEIHSDNNVENSFEKIETATIGFDWDVSNFILTPKNPVSHILSKENKSKKEKLIRVINDVTICRCPVCNVDIDTIDRFCRNCGQNF